VTSPSPENLKTLFEFIFKGFDSLGFKDQIDYEIVQSTNPNHKKAIVRVNIFREHRQTIQYINPTDYEKLSQAELVVVDEAAAIPLPVVKKLFGNYLVFLSSTINGYEGTGRSLSLKLISQLRQNTTNGRKLCEIKLEEPIRYGEGDLIEKWLYDILCLDATSSPQLTTKCPHPDDCNLYFVNRDTLFSFNEASEKFLHVNLILK
jgi:N-acetyltransferase 10